MNIFLLLLFAQTNHTYKVSAYRHSLHSVVIFRCLADHAEWVELFRGSLKCTKNNTIFFYSLSIDWRYYTYSVGRTGLKSEVQTES